MARRFATGKTAKLKFLRKRGDDIIGCRRMLGSLASIASQTRQLSRAAFLARFEAPLLVDAGAAMSDSNGRGFHTQAVSGSDFRRNLATPRESFVFEVAKREGSVFSGSISVGRTTNLDVPIVRPGVSKFHAYFTFAEQTWYLTDKNSKNGTFVGGERLPPDVPRTLQSGDLLHFALHAFRFWDPGCFYELVHADLLNALVDSNS